MENGIIIRISIKLINVNRVSVRERVFFGNEKIRIGLGDRSEDEVFNFGFFLFFWSWFCILVKMVDVNILRFDVCFRIKIIIIKIIFLEFR